MKLLKLAALSSVVLAAQAIAAPTGNGAGKAQVEAKVEFVSPIAAIAKRPLDFGTMLTSWSSGSIEVAVSDGTGTTARTVGTDAQGNNVNIFDDDYTSAHVEISGFSTANAGTRVSGLQVKVDGSAITNTADVLTLDMGQDPDTFVNTLSCTDSLGVKTDSDTCGLMTFTNADIGANTKIDLYFGGELTRGTAAITPKVYTAQFDVTASYY